MKPTVGRIVEFVMQDGQIRPAIIVRVWTDDCVQLQVFTDGHNDSPLGNVIWETSVVRDENKSPRSWDWMEYQKQQAAKKELKVLKEDLKDIHTRHGGMDFSEALMCLKEGKRVQRTGWNGKGMFLIAIWPYGNDQYAIFEKEGLVGTLAPYIAMKTADNQLVPWLASQTDLFATDWTVLEE